MSFIETLPPKLRYKVPPKLRYKIIAQKRRKNSVNTRKARDFSRLIGLIGKNKGFWFDGPIVEMIYRAFLIPQNLMLSLVKPPTLFFGAESGESYRPDLRIGDLVEVILHPLSYFQPNTGNQFIEGTATPYPAQMGFLTFHGSRGEGLMQFIGHQPMMPHWFTFRQGGVTYSLPNRLISSIRKISMSQIP